MAIINLSSHARRNAQAHNAARNVLPREPVGLTEDGTPIVNPLPTSVKVLTAFFVILGILIVGEYSRIQEVGREVTQAPTRHCYMANCCLATPQGDDCVPEVPPRQLCAQ